MEYERVIRRQKGNEKHKWNMRKVKPEKQKDKIKTHIGRAGIDWKNQEGKNVKQIVGYKFSKGTGKVGAELLHKKTW